jgi:glutathione S-transferase
MRRLPGRQDPSRDWPTPFEEDDVITVFGAPPSRAMRVIWMLEEMGLPYEVRPVAFDKRLSDREFLDASPTGAFPGIRDGDVRMMESCAILEYLGAKYGPTPLVPASSDASYPTFIAYLHFGEASLSGPLNVTMATRFFAPEDQKDNWGSRFAIDSFVRKSAALLPPLARSPYIAGDTFTAADISCGYAVGLARFVGVEDRLDPKLREYLGRLAQRPAFQRAMSKQQTPS